MTAGRPDGPDPTTMIPASAAAVTFRFDRKVGRSRILRNERNVATDSSGVARATFWFTVRGSSDVSAFADRTPFSPVSRFTEREGFPAR